jgi:hypothetical protein
VTAEICMGRIVSVEADYETVGEVVYARVEQDESKSTTNNQPIILFILIEPFELPNQPAFYYLYIRQR